MPSADVRHADALERIADCLEYFMERDKAMHPPEPEPDPAPASEPSMALIDPAADTAVASVPELAPAEEVHASER